MDNDGPKTVFWLIVCALALVALVEFAGGEPYESEPCEWNSCR